MNQPNVTLTMPVETAGILAAFLGEYAVEGSDLAGVGLYLRLEAAKTRRNAVAL